MVDGSTFYTPMYYNEHASDSILSHEAICYASDGLLSQWSQSGSPDDPTGKVSFYTSNGAEVIVLTLQKCNGLYDSSVTAVGTNIYASLVTSSTSEPYVVIFYHTNDDNDGDVSIDFDNGVVYPTSPPMVNQNIQSPLHCPIPSGPTMPPISVPMPKASSSKLTRKFNQVDADLWQAQLCHCSDCQLKVIPMSTTGTPTKFSLHPFASFECL